MVCKDCRGKKHDKCKGDTWCDCQHKAPVLPEKEAA